MVRLTPLEFEDIRTLARSFSIAEPVGFGSIDAGTINSNYEVETRSGRFFLRVNEGKSEGDVRYEAELVRALAAGGVVTPAPMLAGNEPFARYLGRCISLFPWVEGRHCAHGEIDAEAVSRLGEALAQLHLVGQSLPPGHLRAGIYTWERIRARFEGFRRRPDAELSEAVRILADEFDWQDEHADERGRAVRGVIHGDLFPDNVLFTPSGSLVLLDFEQASFGSLVYDLAVCVNSWCMGKTVIDLALAQGLIAGYQRRRALAPEEEAALYAELRASAARFTVTRITDVYLRAVDLPDKDFRRFLAQLVVWRGLDSGDVIRMLL
jgi:homoserine kinase type II